MTAPAVTPPAAAPSAGAFAGEPTGCDFAVEPTAIGLQSLVPGVVPISNAQRLAARAAAPLEPKKPQRACDLGLFDLNARNQLDLFAPKDV
ncbi:hypothetical protein [Sphingomonas sp.]|jgi:hypothetical protein|uniref:hypothetical protein n=1 Tax=Sphingomonas sp. TaxID=28214 RepID=UPI002E33836B|nr:hypothetical protein [Sphingomonas sp.]HEX4693601.1 hypothetical protein [Sphingomonas sp.]